MDYLRKLFRCNTKAISPITTPDPIIVYEEEVVVVKKPTILIMRECANTRIPWNEARKRMNLNRTRD